RRPAPSRVRAPSRVDPRSPTREGATCGADATPMGRYRAPRFVGRIVVHSGCSHLDPGVDPRGMTSSAGELGAFLRTRRGEILSEWERSVRHQVGAAQDLPPATVLDHLPAVLEHIADIADELARGEEPGTPSGADRPAHPRL